MSFAAALMSVTKYRIAGGIRFVACMAKRICVGACLAIVAAAALAQTQIGGSITSDTVWKASQGPYIAASDVLIQNGATLTIEAGTTVYMGANTRLMVQAGALKAVGTATSPILITSQKLQGNQTPAPGDWQQLIFNVGTDGATRLEHVRIEYGKGMLVNGAALAINSVQIKNNQGPAITADLAASLTGADNQASGNNINAIVVPDGDITGTVTWGLRGIPYLVLSGSVSVGASPKIASVTPNSLQQGETQTITLTGSRLDGLGDASFTLPGLSVQPVAGATGIQAQLLVTASSNAATGLASLTALTDAGEVKFNSALSVISTQPKLTSVEPSVVPANQGNATVVLKGQNFTNQSVAYLDSTPLQTTFSSATEISAVVPNQTGDAVRAIKLRTPNPAGGPEFVSNDLPLAFVTPQPVANAIVPAELRRGETKSFEITGTGLASTQISTSHPTLAVSNFAATPAKVSFTLSAAADAVLGKQQITLTNAAGGASISVTINPTLPIAAVSPTPIAVPPDGTIRQFAVQLSFADTVSHAFTVNLGDTSIANTSTPTLTIAAGTTQAIGNIKGLKTGTTSITLVSPTLGTLSVPLYVTSDFVGLSTSNAPMLGVVLAAPASQPAQQSAATVSSNLGVVLGSFIQNVSPKAFATGSGPVTLAITGAGLQGATAVSLKPADGITVGSFSIAADGKSLTVPVTIAADAPITQRQVVVLSSTGIPYAVANADADRLLITLPLPEITSVTPLSAVPGTSGATMIVRGSRLQSVQSVNFTPSDGIAVGSSFSINSDGTELSVGITVSPTAPLGQRIVTVTAPTGTSSSTPGVNNTFTVASQVVSNVTPLVSPLVGVVKQDVSAPAQTFGLFAKGVGVAYGTTAISMSPRAKVIGETFTLTVKGIGLQGVTSVSFVPSIGLAVGAPVVASDGLSLAVEVSIAADAPQTARTLKLVAGGTLVAFADPTAATFNVTASLPSIFSVEPIGIQVGATPTVLTIRGQNFQNAQAISFVPPDGMNGSVPIVLDAEATQISVSVSAAANAAPGTRAVVVTTPAGSTSAELTVANALTLSANAPSTNYAVAPLLGVVKQEAGTPAPSTIGPVVAPSIGVVRETGGTAEGDIALHQANQLGLTLGPVAFDVQPKALAVSTSGTLTIKGTALDSVTALIVPPDGVTIAGPSQKSADGTQVSLPISIASNAPATMRTVVLSNAAGKIAFSKPDSASFGIYPNTVPQLSSISPILSTTGSSLTLTINGQNLQNASTVVALPGNGMSFDSQPIVNAAGTQLTVRIQIAPDAPLGARVIQVLTPVTSSATEASPANTFTVYAP
jgi:hypothetical protein